MLCCSSIQSLVKFHPKAPVNLKSAISNLQSAIFHSFLLANPHHLLAVDDGGSASGWVLKAVKTSEQKTQQVIF